MSIPLLGIVDLTPVGAKIVDVISLAQISIEISLEEKARRDFRSGISKVEAGINNLRRLPGTIGTVSGLSQELARARQIDDPTEGNRAVKELLRKLKLAVQAGEQLRKEEQQRQRDEAEQQTQERTSDIRYQSVREEVQQRLDAIGKKHIMRSVGQFSGRLAKIERDTDAADQLLSTGEHEDAVEAIGAVLTACKEVWRDWMLTIRGWKSKHKKLLDKASGYHAVYTDTTVLPDDEGQRFDRAQALLLAPILTYESTPKKQRGGKPDAKAIGKGLDDLHEKAQAAIQQRKEEQGVAERFVAPVVARMRGLLKLAIGRELAEELKQCSDAEKLLAQRDFEGAKALARELNSAYALLEDRLLRAHTAWEQAKKTDLPALSVTLGEQRDIAEEQGFQFKHDPAALLSARFALEEGVMTTRTCTEAVAQVERLKDAAQENSDLFGAWEGIADHRDTEDGKVQDLKDEIEEAIDALAEAMKSAMSQRDDAPDDWAPHDVGGLKSRLGEALSAWKVRCSTATKAEELDATETLEALNKILLAAKVSVRTPQGVEAMLEGDLQNAVVARYDKAEATLASLLPGWALYPIPHADEIRSALEGAQEERAVIDDHEDIAELAERLEQQISRGKGEASLVSGLLDDARGKLAGAVREARKDVAALVEASEKKGLLTGSAVVKLRQRCAQEAQSLSEQIDTIAARHSSDILDVFHDGTTALSALRARCQKLIAACKDGKEGEPLLPDTFATIVKSYRTRLKNKDLKKYRPSDVYLLTQKLDGIEGRIGDEHTSRIDKDLSAWDKDYDDALALAVRDKNEKKAFDQAYEELKGTLDENEALFKGYEAFFKKLRGDLKSAKSQSEAEDGIRGADASLQVARAAIERVLKANTQEGRDEGLDISTELRQGQSEAIANEERGKEQKAAWLARVQSFEARWLPKLPDGEKDATGLLGLAKKSAKQKPPDYDAANRYLKMAADRALLAIQFPGGPVRVSMSKLPGLSKEWSQAVTSYRASFDKLDEHFRTIDDPAGKALLAATTELRSQFDPNAFAAIVGRICASGASGDARAKAREDGLGAVRRYKSLLVKDARFRLLATHPFSGLPAWSSHLTLQGPLNQLERLLLMAVPHA